MSQFCQLCLFTEKKGSRGLVHKNLVEYLSGIIEGKGDSGRKIYYLSERPQLEFRLLAPQTKN